MKTMEIETRKEVMGKSMEECDSDVVLSMSRSDMGERGTRFDEV